jgi:hypothetical protein
MVQIILLLVASIAAVSAKVSREPLYQWYKGLNRENVLYAVNCGANEALTDMNGVEWLADTGFVGGNPSNAGNEHNWLLPNSELYKTERWGDNQNFSYLIPFDVNVDGTYTLVFKFSE